MMTLDDADRIVEPRHEDDDPGPEAKDLLDVLYSSATYAEYVMKSTLNGFPPIFTEEEFPDEKSIYHT